MMTNSVTASVTGGTQFHAVLLDGGLPPSFFVSWGSALAILVGAVAISVRWIAKRSQTRDPNAFAGAVAVQMLLFLLFNTVSGMSWAGCGIGVLDEGMWYLSLAQIIGPLIGNVLVCMLSLTVVSLAAGRLPVIPVHVLIPIVVVLVDVTAILMWTSHVMLMRK